MNVKNTCEGHKTSATSHKRSYYMEYIFIQEASSVFLWAEGWKKSEGRWERHNHQTVKQRNNPFHTEGVLLFQLIENRQSKLQAQLYDR